MKTIIKLAILAVSAVPTLAAAQTYLYIPSAQDHFDIDGIGGGGPFDVQILTGPSKTFTGAGTMYCDSIPQEFSLGQTFEVQVETIDATTNTSLDPWVITRANSEASLFDSANSVVLTHKQIVSAIQGVIWHLDSQITGTITSGDSGTADFANFLLSEAGSKGTYDIGGFARYDAGPNYKNGNGVFGQSQIGPVPEPSTFLMLAIPLVAIALRRRA